MTGVRVTVNTRSVERYLDRMANLDTAPLFDAFGGYMVARTDERFEQETGPDGRQWEQSQRARNEGGVTLTDHGHLRDSITHNVFPGGDGVEIGSNMVYAAIHQFGGRAGRGRRVTIPQRQYLGFDDTDIREIDLITHDFLRDASEAASAG